MAALVCAGPDCRNLVPPTAPSGGRSRKYCSDRCKARSYSHSERGKATLAAHARTPERVEQRRAWADSARGRELRERARLRRLYGWDGDQVDRILRVKSSGCMLADTGAGECRGRLCVDHDHKSGAFRGWLCISHNTALGDLGDSSAGLRAALAYLEQAPHADV